MNITGDSLFRLIKTMSEAECKQFQEMLERNPGPDGISSYQRLFECLASADFYKEEKVKKQLEEYIPFNSFPVIKNHLREKILDYLRTKEPESGRNRIHKMLDEVEVLYNRQFYKEAYIICNRIIEESIKLDINYFVIETNHWRLLIEHIIAGNDMKEEIKSINDQTSLHLKKMQFSLQLGELNETILSYVSQNTNMRSTKFLRKMRQWQRHPLLQISGNDKRLTLTGKILMAISKDVTYRSLGEIEKAYQSQKWIKDIFLSDWNFYVKNKRQICVSILHNFFVIVSLTKHYDEYEKHLRFVEKVLQNEFKNNRVLYLSCQLNRFFYTILTAKNNLSRKQVAEFEKFYQSEKNALPFDARALYSIAYSYAAYYTAQYEKGIDALKAAIDEYKRNRIRQDQIEDLQISLLIQRFLSLISKRWSKTEAKDFHGMLTPFYESFRKKSKDENYRFEMCLIHLFRKLDYETSRKEMMVHILKAEKELNSMFAKPYPYLKIVAATFDHEEWIARCKSYLAKD